MSEASGAAPPADGASVKHIPVLLAECLEALDAISGFLHAQLGDQSPNLGKLDAALEGAARMLAPRG